MRTRLQNNVVKPKQLIDGTILYPLNRKAFTLSASHLATPTSHVQAMKHPKWKEAMDAEYNALLKNKAWHLNVIDCKWVFKLKQNLDDTVNRCKARLIAKGFK